MNKVSKKEKVFYITVGVILVTILSVLMSIRVQSKSREAVLFDNSTCMEAEAKYRQQVQEILEIYEVYNSGLTMTRVVSMDGEREYHIKIYHNKFRKLESGEKEDLCRALSDCMVCLPDGSEYAVNITLDY